MEKLHIFVKNKFTNSLTTMRYIIFSIFLGFAFGYQSQTSYNVIELETSKSKTRGSDFVGIDKDGFIYTTSLKTTWIVVSTIVKPYLKVFNARTGEMHIETPLKNHPGLKGRSMEYVSLRFIDEKPTIICKKRKADKPIDYYGIHIDRNGQLQGDAFKVGVSGDCKGFFKRGKSFYSGVYQHKSKNGNLTFISDVSCNNDELKTYRVLRLDSNFEIIHSFSFKLDYEIVRNISFVNNEEHLFLKVETREKEKVDGKIFKKWINTNRLFKINNEDGSLSEINIEEKFAPLRIGDFRMQVVDNGILLSGQIIQEKGFAGLFSALLKKDKNEITDLKTEDFDIDFVTKYWSERQKKRQERRRKRKGESEEDENFSTNFELMETFNTSDGGLVSVFQEFELDIVTHTTTGTNGVATTTTYYYYYYRDVIVVKTGKDGNIEYTKLLPFYQLTINYDPGIGYSALQNGNDIYFLHGSSNEMDEMIEEGRKSKKRSRWKDRKIQYASITHLNKNGDIDTEQVFDVREKDVSIDPSNVAIDPTNKQFVIVSPVTKMFNFKRTKVIRIEL